MSLAVSLKTKDFIHKTAIAEIGYQFGSEIVESISRDISGVGSVAWLGWLDWSYFRNYAHNHTRFLVQPVALRRRRV